MATAKELKSALDAAIETINALQKRNAELIDTLKILCESTGRSVLAIREEVRDKTVHIVISDKDGDKERENRIAALCVSYQKTMNDFITGEDTPITNEIKNV